MRILMALMGRGPRPTPKMLPPDECLAGSSEPISDAPAKGTVHYRLKTPLYGPFEPPLETVLLGMGCFWCSENLFDGVTGIYSTQVGYAGGVTQNPSYRQVSSGRTNHNEVVRVVYDPAKLEGLVHSGFAEILRIFWENHDPTTPMQQGNDQGTQYRSGLYYTSEAQREMAIKSKEAYAAALTEAGHEAQITTEILPAPEFFMAEDSHQQVLCMPTNSRPNKKPALRVHVVYAVSSACAVH